MHAGVRQLKVLVAALKRTPPEAAFIDCALPGTTDQHENTSNADAMSEMIERLVQQFTRAVEDHGLDPKLLATAYAATAAKGLVLAFGSRQASRDLYALALQLAQDAEREEAEQKAATAH